jgi:flagellar motility protein MotE (MotC chaperone)
VAKIIALLKRFMIPGVALLAFLATAAIALAVQGRLNSKAFDAFRKPEARPAEQADQTIPQEPAPVTPLRQLRIAELDQLVHEAKKATDLLAQRTRQLDQQEDRIKTYRQEINAEKQTLDRLRADLELREAELKKREDGLTKKLVEIEQTETESLRKYALVYASMDPARAATSLLLLDGLDAAKILFYMQEKKSAKIFEEIRDGAKVAEILQQFKTLTDKSKATGTGAQP